MQGAITQQDKVSDNHLTHYTVLIVETWSLLGSVRSNRQTGPAGSFAMYALPSSVLLQQNFNQKPTESSFQFYIKKYAAIFLITYIFINTAKKSTPSDSPREDHS